MRVISMLLCDREIARIEEDGSLKKIEEFKCSFPPNLAKWYDDCFYGIPNSATFDERFELVKVHNYFCYSNPGLLLAARTLP